VRAAAAAQGAPLAPACAPTSLGARCAFSDPALVGELRFDLLQGELSIGWRLGTAESGKLPGTTAVERLLDVTRGGIENPLAGLKLAGDGYKARVERLGGTSGDVAAAETHAAPFDAETFGEVLDALRTQHPADVAGGRKHRGSLVVEWRLSTDAALAGRDPAIKSAVKAILDLVRIAERASARAKD
jgi:hypothetical protein